MTPGEPFPWLACVDVLQPSATGNTSGLVILGLRDTEQLVLLAGYILWREGVSPIDGNALERMRSRRAPHILRERNALLGSHVLEQAILNLLADGLIEVDHQGLRPTLHAVVTMERAIATGGGSPKAKLSDLLRRAVLARRS